MLGPGVEPSASDPQGAVEAVKDRVVLLEWRPFDLGMRERNEGVRVVLEGPNPSADNLDVLLRHRLSRQPGCFEGLVFACEDAPLGDLPGADHEQERKQHLDWNPGALTAAAGHLLDHYLVAQVGHADYLDAIVVPLLGPDGDGFKHPRMAVLMLRG